MASIRRSLIWAFVDALSFALILSLLCERRRIPLSAEALTPTTDPLFARGRPRAIESVTSRRGLPSCLGVASTDTISTSPPSQTSYSPQRRSSEAVRPARNYQYPRKPSSFRHGGGGDGRGGGGGGGIPRRGNHYHENYRRRRPTDAERWESAIQAEKRMQIELEQLEKFVARLVTSSRSIAIGQSRTHNTVEHEVNDRSSRHTPSTRIAVTFPSVRECNSALATFGAKGDFLRALRLFLKMRKAASLARKLQQQRQEQSYPSIGSSMLIVPAPTLVTYSTMMSRAISVGKPALALRLWHLCKLQAEFFSIRYPNTHQPLGSSPMLMNGERFTATSPTTTIIPDVKAANILMNAYAKMADVESASYLMEQMLHGNGTDVPMLEPNLVTYNTFFDACHKAGELDAALHMKHQMDTLHPELYPDARTYTSLIATVARRGSKASRLSGAHDPTLAFQWMEEMKTVHGIAPNGMTYSALIDACGRCQRPDLALNALREMIRTKHDLEMNLRRNPSKQDRRLSSKGNRMNDEVGYDSSSLMSNEEGAWTAAIHALGKAGRVDSAQRLFYSMGKATDAKPNQVTCGCLMDCLLQDGRTMETLELIRFMKQNGIPPTEVMYTQLMTSAERLFRETDKKTEKTKSREGREEGGGTEYEAKEKSRAHAIEMYTALMKSLTETSLANSDGRAGGSTRTPPTPTNRQHAEATAVPSPVPVDSTEDDAKTRLFRVFLVFQGMKAVGAKPDLACYNALLGACANAADWDRAQEVLKRLLTAADDDNDASSSSAHRLHPNDATWKELLRTTAKLARSDLAEEVWRQGMEYGQRTSRSRSTSLAPSVIEKTTRWNPSVDSFGALLSAYLQEARHAKRENDHDREVSLYKRVVLMYKDVLTKSERRKVNKEELHQNPRTLLKILDAIVMLEQGMWRSNNSSCSSNQPQQHQDVATTKKRSSILRHLGSSIVNLPCFIEQQPAQKSNDDVEKQRDRQYKKRQLQREGRAQRNLNLARVWALEEKESVSADATAAAATVR